MLQRTACGRSVLAIGQNARAAGLAGVAIGRILVITYMVCGVLGGISVAGGEANLPGIWGVSLFMVLLLTMLNTFGAGDGMRLLLTGLGIAAVVVLVGGRNLAR